MKIHFQKRFTKMIAFAMSAIIIISTMTVNVQAAVLTTTGTTLSLEKVIDMALTKTGIVANNNFLQKTQASILNMMNNTASSYSNYCEANALEKNEETWAQYLSSDAYISLGFQLPYFILQCAEFLMWNLTPELYETDQERIQVALKALAGTASCVQGQTYSMSDEAVEYVRDTFDDVVETEGLGYYYVNVYPSNSIDINLFKSLADYQNCVSYIDSGLYNTAVFHMSNCAYILDNWDKVYYVRQYSNFDRPIRIYAEDWNIFTNQYYIEFNASKDIIWCDATTFKEYAVNEQFYTTCYIGESKSGYAGLKFYSKEGGRQIIFEDITAMKEYSVGIRPFYSITDNYYDNSVDNSINFTGDYIVNNADKLSYDTIYNEIVNQNDYSENVVNNIVNDNTQTIVNNYYYTNPDGGGDSGDGGDDNGSGGGLGALIDGIGSVLNFIVTLIGDALTLVTGFLDTIYTLLKNLGGSFTNFSGLLGELFTFIPQELIDLISASISVTIAVCLICLLKR